MDQNIFINHCQGALDNIRYNISRLTDRYIETEDPSCSYTEAVAPLLKQQLDILNLLKDSIKE